MREIDIPWLLVATPQLQDPNFAQGVVLMVEDSDVGSMGFLINRPIDTPISELVDLPPGADPATQAWFGGPVGHDSGVILHLPRTPDHGFSLTGSTEILEELADRYGPEAEGTKKKGLRYPYRFLVGHSGWGPGQLQDEILSGAWLQIPYSHELVFNVSPDAIWQVAMNGLGFDPSRLAPPPVGRYLN